MSRHQDDQRRIVPPYFFHADAVAIGGVIEAVTPEPRGGPGNQPAARAERLTRPLTIVGASCALPSNGGVTESSRGRTQTQHEGQNLISFARARARTEGRIVDDIAVVRASTQISDLQIGDCQPMFVSDASSELRAHVPLDNNRANMDLLVRLSLGPLDVYRARIEVDFHDVSPNNLARFGLQRRGTRLAFMQNVERPCERRQSQEGEPVLTTNLVRGEIRIFGNSDGIERVPHHDNALYIRDIGYVFFGEAIITPTVQRVSVMRFEFGCNCEGRGGVGDVGTNGGP